ncbi:UDP-4-amino-4,6-dideoxy-N-acetyl-beta-L-altrosamine transaminase [Saccharibacillus alkalitolerans]|uniref:UDP-4-amino-4, 6-dideoxy-N-acetyl-beta-L-altrosamine transaminase n=1 Tax=Saccharibacillus alkalitolerans TaxID=2705290 RepID=A0ABX0FD50_9BACL|nr:UDP-4-amino-4,6-dideoxy-N-acetyl-beta-L-altrosamine transaminase [Saccharibacillus alkalitolerans]NGZ76107.1 UDP-4-amino-4,6-dideoxy-N-acetyl-beta-L-altrosamine transaminase [Saccharibacillus alkalitolerans]
MELKKRDNLLPYGKQWLDEADIEAVHQVLRGDFITQGPAIQAFEQKVAEYSGAKYGVAFCNGTAALHGACFAAQIGPRDEVITTPLTFLASSNCVLYQGGIPVFADILPDTYNIDPEQIKAKLTSSTKAVIPVDFSGQPVEIDRIMDIAKDHNLIVIQDAAHSLGAEYKGKKIGAWADMTMFSFHPVKHITTGEGGMIVTDSELFYKRLLQFRNHGMTRDPEEVRSNEGPWYYEMQTLGYNYRMTDIQAALGISQMDKLDKFVEKRRMLADLYEQKLSKIPGVILPHQHKDALSSWHLYVVRFTSEFGTLNRKEIFEALRAMNVGVNVHYIPVYLQPYYRELGYNKGICPNAEAYYENAITLPLFPGMEEEDVEYVVECIKKISLHARDEG